MEAATKNINHWIKVIRFNLSLFIQKKCKYYRKQIFSNWNSQFLRQGIKV